ncbi:hypothetical protein EJB05_50029 [Eragrostis curvula]|uniref:Uncharacterized protein n=1 Tax=Eragrostis curvula TaxID=38414 RepID=A0A5J9SZL2_9POAL|nr:hypothetical protein EJB05_50029 [Eragrostis curvula]
MMVVKLSVSDSGFQNGLGSSTVVEVTESVEEEGGTLATLPDPPVVSVNMSADGPFEPYEKCVATRKYVNQMLVMFSTGVKGQ